MSDCKSASCPAIPDPRHAEVSCWPQIDPNERRSCSPVEHWTVVVVSSWVVVDPSGFVVVVVVVVVCWLVLEVVCVPDGGVVVGFTTTSPNGVTCAVGTTWVDTSVDSIGDS